MYYLYDLLIFFFYLKVSINYTTHVRKETKIKFVPRLTRPKGRFLFCGFAAPTDF